MRVTQKDNDIKDNSKSSHKWLNKSMLFNGLVKTWTTTQETCRICVATSLPEHQHSTKGVCWIFYGRHANKTGRKATPLSLVMPHKPRNHQLIAAGTFTLP
ncbi:hypothetical protein GOODEAATRI_008569 [Goodea atripinnis]|uniref:Uncharacterized protein n=1 Tax=Goodea atripinnis TaxID=208336 RepID=A0ABV0NJL5_9TELE